MQFSIQPLLVSLFFIHSCTHVLSATSSGRGPPLPATRIDLSSLHWSLANTNRSITVPTSFLNQPHLALIEAGLIQDPNIGLNEGTTRWVGEEGAWTWESKINIGDDPAWSDVDRFYLVFEGLDTFCDIHLGGEKVGSTDNSFRSWVFDVTDVLEKSHHQPVTLTLRFASAWATATRLANEPGNIWFPLASSGSSGRRATTIQPYEYSHRNWARKQQSDFGWDWGPAYLPSGPIQPGYLLGLSGPQNEKRQKTNLSGRLARNILTKPDDSKDSGSSHEATKPVGKHFPAQLSGPMSSVWVHRSVIDIYRKGQRNNLPPDQTAPWIINITLPITSPIPADANSLTLSGSLAGTAIRLPATKLTLLPPSKYRQFGPDYTFTAQFTVQPGAVELWYPKSIGNPKLYDLELTLEMAGKNAKLQKGDDSTSRLTWHERVGFRTILVDQSRYTKEEVSRGIQPGTRFSFAINGKPFYVQGSSMIPIDTFTSRTNATTIRWLIESALLSHQNVVRVWGGGAYQTDEFYDICDELGILVWSESVFACGAYPISPEFFLHNIRAEVAENVARLNRHPSVALWAGNNEGEGYLTDVRNTWPNGSIYFDQYDYLNNRVIRDVVLENTRSISYIPSSTTQGYLTLEPYVSRYSNKTEGEIYGDQEHYNSDTSISFDLSSYPVARFVNEFGFPSLPSIHTLDRILNTPEAYGFNSSVMRAHDKNPPAGSLEYPFPADGGQRALTTGVTMYYPTPNIADDPRTLLAQWAYTTQVFQASFMGSQIHYYRLGASRGENNMGAVYWQLNDIWEGISWSSIEYTGRWKIFHYLAERVQDHVIVSPIYHAKNDTLDIYVTSDLWQPVAGSVQLTWYDFVGQKVWNATKNFSVGPINSTQIFHASGLSNIVPNGQPPNDAWLHLALKTEDGKYLNEQFFHPIKLKDCQLRPTKVIARAIGHNQVSVEVARGGVAAWVNVEHPPGVRGYFKDIDTDRPSNAFFLRPNERRKLEFVLKGYDDEALTRNLENKMTARNMWDNQHRSA